MSEEFDEAFLEKQKKALLGLKEKILNNLAQRDNLSITSDDLKEDNDHAQITLNQNVELGLKGERSSEASRY